jgi:hypothetical protein
MILRFGSISELVLIEYWKAGIGRESPDANGKVRPNAHNEIERMPPSKGCRGSEGSRDTLSWVVK